jgi:hypothetical protein
MPRLREVLLEVDHREFAPAIGTQGTQLLATLPLGCRLDILDGRRHTIFSGQQHHPHVSVVVINKQEEIVIPV